MGNRMRSSDRGPITAAASAVAPFNRNNLV
jgi:hypothetical protein